MAKQSEYLTAPLKTDKMPPGVPFIIGNEAAERFSFYGLNSILVVFMTKYLHDAQGHLALMSDTQANGWYHFYMSAVYGLCILGAFLSDALLGKFWTIFSLSIVYCFGHLTLSIDQTRLGLVIGLGLVALGAGGIKPCVSANVGDQFGVSNQHLLQRVFSWFYFSVNFGSVGATLLIPELLHGVGARAAFGAPGILMLLATVIFWWGRKRFVHIPPAGLKSYFRELATRENFRALGNLVMLMPFAAMFWALWNQNFSAWVEQADKMDRHFLGREWLPAEIQSVNPLFILLMLPLFSYVIYPALNKIVPLTPLRKLGGGLFVICVSFLIIAWIQTKIDAGQTPNIGWQVLAFLVLTASEVMVSVTHLEFAYTQAPKKMKSLVMCTYLGTISLGNLFTSGINFLIERGVLKLQGAAYFFFFVVVMFVTALLFLVFARLYKGKTYLQDEA